MVFRPGRIIPILTAPLNNSVMHHPDLTYMERAEYIWGLLEFYGVSQHFPSKDLFIKAYSELEVIWAQLPPGRNPSLISKEDVQRFADDLKKNGVPHLL